MISHSHSEARPRSAYKRGLLIALSITASIMVAEAIGGVLSNSLALVGDAGHMLIDTMALGLSLFAIIIAQRPATPTKTFGFHRVEVLAAMANGAILILVSFYIFYEAYQRLLSPPTINASLMLPIAAIGLSANVVGIYVLRGMRRHNLNVRGAFLHMAGDTLSSVGVIIGGIVILVTGWYLVDPIISVLIGLIILGGAVRLVRESSDILLESVPKHIDMGSVVAEVTQIPGVQDFHDVHIWTITSGVYALSAHLLIEDQRVSECSQIIAEVNQLLGQRFGLGHTTLQLECESCESSPACDLRVLQKESLTVKS